MKNKKIILIGSIPPPYHGVTVQNELLLNSKLKSNFVLIHLDTSDKRDLNNIGKFDFVNVILGLIHFLNLIFSLILYKPNILYLTVAQNSLAFIRDGLFIIAGKLFSNAKIVIHFRGQNYYRFYLESNFFLKNYINKVFRYCDAGIVLGANLREMVSKWFTADQIFVIPNGTNFNPNLNNKKFIGDKICLGYMGYLAEEKGVDDLIQAVHEVTKIKNNVKLLLAGEFAFNNLEFQKRIYSFIEKNGLQSSVEFRGRITGDEKEKFFLETDIFVFPSWTEGHPNVILEAMSSACPVIATDVGAISESVINGTNGYLVTPRAPKELADKIVLLINDKKLISEMSHNSRKLFEEKFTTDIYINKMKNVFDFYMH